MSASVIADSSAAVLLCSAATVASSSLAFFRSSAGTQEDDTGDGELNDDALEVALELVVDGPFCGDGGEESVEVEVGLARESLLRRPTSFLRAKIWSDWMDSCISRRLIRRARFSSSCW